MSDPLTRTAALRSMLAQSHVHRMHLPAGAQCQKEHERGRSRTPKPTGVAVPLGEEPYRKPLSRSNLIAHVPRTRSMQSVHRTLRLPPKGPSPDRSEPGALEDAIHEAYARGDLRQCLQWVLEMQGVYLEWDDPRLDTVTEDDLCFSEQTGMGPGATFEERARAETYWAMRRAEDDEIQRSWELTASQAEREASRRFRDQHEAEQRRRDARAQYFRAPRPDKAHPIASSSRLVPQRPNPPSTLSRSLDLSPAAPPGIRRPSRSRPRFLFPLDEGELSAVRSMWLDQGRKGLELVEALVRPHAEPPAQTTEPTSTDRQSNPSDSPDSPSTSMSSSAPSALFSSVPSMTSTATSVSTITCPDSRPSPLKASFPRTKETALPASPKSRLIPVTWAECPLHTHMAAVSLWQSFKDERVHKRGQSSVRSPERHVSRRSRTTTPKGWLSRGGKAVSGFVDLVGRLPTAYGSALEQEMSSLRSSSCPAQIRPLRTPTPYPSSETVIFLLPLRTPSHPRIFPALPTLPRSPYCPLVPPPRPTPRVRLVPNPQFLRLKALHNRVLWGLIPVPPSECDVLADIARRHGADVFPGRPDVDRLGNMFTAREALLRVAVDGVGRSTLASVAGAEESARTWMWWPMRT